MPLLICDLSPDVTILAWNRPSITNLDCGHNGERLSEEQLAHQVVNGVRSVQDLLASKSFLWGIAGYIPLLQYRGVGMESATPLG
ncbi:uncharacterized protein ARMOST_07662 [Armillaria ostoyae]|uniref:Uncharacterized protein n=1 Tax=Armillaria ostoyae TaxID=47428 RepID=A0A284R6E7_ARMOS|nr:uncharacterized protein ARMOST_07662 [Armillaria ostoyae]